MSTTKKNKHAPLGKALMKSIQKKNFVTPHDDMATFFQKSQTNDEFEKALRMKSIIERDSLTEFLVEAEMSNKGFEADRNLKMKDIREELMSKRIKQPGEIHKENEALQLDRNRLLANLRIPRKPHWSKEDTKANFLAKQNEAFLDWRRKLAQVEEKEHHIKMTPFEKNIEVWKQLWRVVERARVLIQIVDARDPLSFRCEDLETYVKEVGVEKRNLLLINKSDLVSEEMRTLWSTHLNERGIDHIFFSAKIEQTKIDEEEEPAEQLEKVPEVDEPIEGSEVVQPTPQPELTLQSVALADPKLEAQHDQLKVTIPAAFLNTHRIASCADVIGYITELRNELSKTIEVKPDQKEEETNKPFQLEVGMVGYPNVGKSSVINSLFGKKKVGVASQPGKTKHYQTLYLTPTIVLCDCPGLVFPNVASTTAEMVLNGVIPIDNLRQYQTPMNLLVQRIPKRMIEDKYGLRLKDDIYTAETLLQGFASLKGFHTGRGLPNESMAARIILKDYTSGHLSHCQLPPGCKPLEVKPEAQQPSEPRLQAHDVNMKRLGVEEKNFDEKFFDSTQTKVTEQDQLIKGMSSEELLDLVEGNTVHGLRLKKDQRKQIKFAIKRGENLDDIKKKYLLSKHVVQEGGHKQYIRS